MSRFFLAFGNEEDENERGDQEHHRIKEIANDLKGGDATFHRSDSGNGDEKLRAEFDKVGMYTKESPSIFKELIHESLEGLKID